MNLNQVYISYKEIADCLNISVATVANKVAPNIIKAYGIDKSRIAVRSSLPRAIVEDYFDYSAYLKPSKVKK